MELSVTPLPVVDLGPDATLCVGQNLVLDAAVPGGSYVWQDGSTLGSFVVSGPGNYNVTVTVNGCSASDAINVGYNALPVVDLGPDITLCTGQTTTLDATVPGGTYGWQDGSGNPTFNVTGPGTYTVNVSANGCSTNDAINVAYNTTPVSEPRPGPRGLCWNTGGTERHNARRHLSLAGRLHQCHLHSRLQRVIWGDRNRERLHGQ